MLFKINQKKKGKGESGSPAHQENYAYTKKKRSFRIMHVEYWAKYLRKVLMQSNQVNYKAVWHNTRMHSPDSHATYASLIGVPWSIDVCGVYYWHKRGKHKEKGE